MSKERGGSGEKGLRERGMGKDRVMEAGKVKDEGIRGEGGGQDSYKRGYGEGGKGIWG